jgi:hypothetical protein
VCSFYGARREAKIVKVILLQVFPVALDQFSHLTIANAVRVPEISGVGKTTVGFLLIAFFNFFA